MAQEIETFSEAEAEDYKLLDRKQQSLQTKLLWMYRQAPSSVGYIPYVQVQYKIYRLKNLRLKSQEPERFISHFPISTNNRPDKLKSLETLRFSLLHACNILKPTFFLTRLAIWFWKKVNCTFSPVHNIFVLLSYNFFRCELDITIFVEIKFGNRLHNVSFSQLYNLYF